MTRRNPRIEELERENAALRRELAERQRDPGDMPLLGCGDQGCIVSKPRGMATTGACRCDTWDLKRAVRCWRRCAAFLEETIREQAPVVACARELVAWDWTDLLVDDPSADVLKVQVRSLRGAFKKAGEG